MLMNISDRILEEKTVAVVDDEEDILELVMLHLKKNHYSTVGFTDAASLKKYLQNEMPDLVILDLMLPDADGLDICREFRNDPVLVNLPVIILTARGDETDKISGLEIGADDYITKPFSPRELVARVKAVLRREDKVIKTNVLSVDGMIKIDTDRHEVFISGEKIALTGSEFKILALLAEKPGIAFPREVMLERLGVQSKGVLDRTIDVHIKNLREKIGSEAGKLIVNVRGIGYKLEQI